jgi:Chemotaxis signal transduction protein
MHASADIVVFTLEGRRFGVPMEAVERIIRLIDYHPLPRAPEIVAGVIDFQGEVLPLVELRRRFHLPSREPLLSDQLILVRTPRRRLALLVDRTEELAHVPPADWVPAATILPRAEHLAGAVKHPDGLILIHDIDACLSLDEEQALNLALAGPPRS